MPLAGLCARAAAPAARARIKNPNMTRPGWIGYYKLHLLLLLYYVKYMNLVKLSLT